MTDTTRDKIEKMCGALIQHGDLNHRIYLMKIGDAKPSELLPALDRCAEENEYTKIFAKLPATVADPFLEAGYAREAEIPNYYNLKTDCVFLSRFIDPARAELDNEAELDRTLSLAKSKISAGISKSLRDDAVIRACRPEDAEAMSEIYREVFPSYPFPIDDPAYLRETMRTHIAYFGVEIDGKLVALASSEMDRDSSSVEMTDFATLPDWLGNGFAVHLLTRMEADMVQRDIATAYTIARAVSPGMNITFAKLGYAYGGRLRNNTNISGQIESMNIWHKSLSDP